jgi:hypothetical protein
MIYALHGFEVWKVYKHLRVKHIFLKVVMAKEPL